MSKAYLDSSITVTQDILENQEGKTYFHGQTALFLLFQVYELFYKGAIFFNTGEHYGNNHYLGNLQGRYGELYPKKNFKIKQMFSFEAPTHEKSHEMKLRQQFINKRLPAENRFPIDTDGIEWEGIGGFTPELFLIDLGQIKKDFERTIPLILQEESK